MGMSIDDIKHCLKVMVDCEVCEECNLYGTSEKTYDVVINYCAEHGQILIDKDKYENLQQSRKANAQLKKQIEMLKLDRDCEKPSGKWIPVSERLPDTEDKVLCWYEYYHWSKEKILPEYGIGQYIVNEWYGEVSHGLGARVIAWQPLPKPYVMESEDNNGKD